jgi:hypothetical protein|tara:strand:- start:242 stop:577 length:336 start_codon:yes stop_codon:yes gene_type:complete
MATKPVKVNKKVVGNVDGDTLHKTVDSSKHFLRTPPAIAFDELALSKAKEMGATKIKVKDKRTGLEYHTSIVNLENRGFTFNRGFGDQIGLSLSEWSKSEESQIKIFNSKE